MINLGKILPIATLMLIVFSHPARAESEIIEQDNEANPPELIVHRIIPSDTDNKITTFTTGGYQHWSWYNSAAKDKHQLVVFLPGTGGKGKGSGKFNKAAAKWGYHVISMAYPDSISMSWFHGSADPDAFERARYNIITGKLPYQGVKIDRPNSIENRLLAVLRFLAKNYPDEKWEQFLDQSGNIAWERSILTGQSQGGGHACFMAIKLHRVARVLCFGSPKDFNIRYAKPGKWLSYDSMTAKERFFCFNHCKDDRNGCTYAHQLLNYRALGLSPKYGVVDVGKAQPPFEHTHLLTTSIQTGDPHNQPLHDGRNRPVWKYMLFESVE